MSVIRNALLKRCNNAYGLQRFLTPAARNLADDSHPNIGRSASADIVIPEVSIPEFIHSRIPPYSGFTAIECSVTGKKYKFEEIGTKTRNLSKALRKIFKLDSNDTIAIFLPNCPDYLIASLGVMESRMRVTSINPFYTPDEISRQLLDSSAKIVITNGLLVDTIKKALTLIKKDLPIITIKRTNDESLTSGAVSFDELTSTTFDLPDVAPAAAHDIAFLPYSSGTTGLPKGVELTHYNIVSNLLQGSHKDYNPLLQPSDSYQEITPGVLPMFHIYGFSITLLNSVAQGCKVVSMEKFTPDLYLSVIKEHNITVMYAAPPLVLYLTMHPDVKPEYLKHLKMVTSGAAPLGSSDEERFLEKFGNNIKIGQGYGMTETSPLVTFSPVKFQNTPEGRGSVGTAVPNTLLKIIDPEDSSGSPLGPNQPGELLIKGPQVMKGYHNRPEETAKTMLDGWLRSGDIATHTENGTFFIADRLKELIKVRGFQVPPAELEEVIRSYPSVQDAAVIGVPHPIDGEVPRAFIMVKNNHQLNIDELKDFVAKKVAKYKQLKGGVEIVDSIPKNASGKILRKVLKENFKAQSV